MVSSLGTGCFDCCEGSAFLTAPRSAGDEIYIKIKGMNLPASIASSHILHPSSRHRGLFFSSFGTLPTWIAGAFLFLAIK
jgi:hypothetical protein